MDLNAFEAAVREVAFLAVLVTGCALVLGIACAAVVWTVKGLLHMFGMTSNFLAFVRSRRRGQK
jgi:hypothetical protein